MTLAATVLVPTHDHGPTLLRSVRSALAQTVEALEVLVVGDGVPDATRKVMEELVASDPRVKFLDNPKGPRHGELHRHAALQEARGEIVCYLSDDDLWLPDHVAEMQSLLAERRLRARAAVLDRRREPDPAFPRRPLPRVLPRAPARRGEPHSTLLRSAHTRALSTLAARLADYAGRHVHRSVHVAADPFGSGLSRDERQATDRPALAQSRA